MMPKIVTPRQAAARKNRKKWKGHSPEGLEALRQRARANRPWEFSTGPRSADGKRISSMNAVTHGGRANTLLPPHVKAVIEAIRGAERGEGEPPPFTEVEAALYHLMDGPGVEWILRSVNLLSRYQSLMLAHEARPRK
jgi:hypothetical protein